MKRLAMVLCAVPVVCTLWAFSGPRQEEGGAWEPYKFRGDERFEYRFLTPAEGENPAREVGYSLDIRRRGEEDCEVTWSLRAPVRKADVGEKILFGMWTEVAPAWVLMNPMYGAFISQVELKEGEKMSLFGAGVIKVTGRETVGGRTGLTCKFYLAGEKKEELSFECTIDPELALPIRSVTYEEGREKSRAELVSYKKD